MSCSTGIIKKSVGKYALPLLGKLSQNHTVFHQKRSLHPEFRPQNHYFLKIHAPVCKKKKKRKKLFAPPFSKVCVRACWGGFTEHIPAKCRDLTCLFSTSDGLRHCYIGVMGSSHGLWIAASSQNYNVIFSWAQIGRSATFGSEIGVPDREFFFAAKIFNFSVKNCYLQHCRTL